VAAEPEPQLQARHDKDPFSQKLGLIREMPVSSLPFRFPAGIRENGNVRSPQFQPRQPPLPPGTVTGIGSLPFTSTAAAIQAIATSSPEVPFWPQMPRLSERESIIGQGLGVLSDLIEPRAEGYGYNVREGKIDLVVEALHRGAGELTPANAAGFGAFEQAISSGMFGSAVAVKGQIEGPITLSAYLFHRGSSFLADPVLFAAVAFHISQIICWQIDRLKTAGLPVLLFVDEPALCLEVPAANTVSEQRRLTALAATLEGARLRGAYAGLHCCAARPLSRMCRVKPDILSFDAYEGLELFFSDPDAMAFVREGGIVAYGLIPTLQDLRAVRAEHIFTRWLTLAAVAGDPRQFARNAIVTATCGLGLLTPDSVAESFALARSVGRLIRAIAGQPQLFAETQTMAASESTGS
jgi:hypothetical protein